VVFLCPFFTIHEVGICIKINKMQDSDFQQKERAAGNRAAAALRAALRSKIQSTFTRRSGAMEKSTVLPRFKDGVLDRLVLKSPKYSFTQHFGSSKTGQTPATSRGEANVQSFTRKLNGTSVEVKSYKRAGGLVIGHKKGIEYKSKNHISEALKSTNALETLATELGENRIVNITSQIDF
jgi:hypothetical protein